MKKTSMIVGGAFVAIGLIATIFVLYKSFSRPSSLSDNYDEFNGYTFDGSPSYDETPMSCMKQCNESPFCKGAAFDYSSQVCKLTAMDPFVVSHPAASGTWSTFVRRPVGQEESKWTAWTPDKCPPCGEKTDTVQKRTCQGVHCLGEDTHDCKVSACYDQFGGLRMT